MAVRHEQRTCEICGLPGGAIRLYENPDRLLALVEAHPRCIGVGSKLVLAEMERGFEAKLEERRRGGWTDIHKLFAACGRGFDPDDAEDWAILQAALRWDIAVTDSSASVTEQNRILREELSDRGSELYRLRRAVTNVIEHLMEIPIARAIDELCEAVGLEVDQPLHGECPTCSCRNEEEMGDE